MAEPMMVEEERVPKPAPKVKPPVAKLNTVSWKQGDDFITFPSITITLVNHLKRFFTRNNIIESPIMIGYTGSPYLIIPEAIKFRIRDILGFIVDLHKRNKTVKGGFSIDNVALNRESKIVFLEVEFTDQTINDIHLDERKVNDFYCVHEVIRGIFDIGKETNQNTPGRTFIEAEPAQIPILSDLMKRLKSKDKNRLADDIITCHLSLLSSAETIHFINRCIEIEPFMHRGYYSLFTSFGDNEKWRCNLVGGEGVTRQWTRDSPVFKCFLNSKYITGTAKPTNAYEASHGCISFCRNLATHLGEELKKYTLGSGYIKVPPEQIHVTSSILSLYGVELLALQESLSSHRILQYIALKHTLEYYIY